MAHTGWQIGDLMVEVVEGDIVAQPDLGAIVNAANAGLMPGLGVSGAIHRAAGPGLAAECRALAPITTGEAVLSGGHGLPNRHVIHCLGPVFGRDEPAAALLSSCYVRALGVAEENGIERVGFPALSTGLFGYPMPEAARVAAETILEEAGTLESVRLVRMVLFGEPAARLHEQVFREVLEDA